MPTLHIFVSFEFDRDRKLKNDFFGQAKNETHHRVKNSSLKESYPDKGWQQKAREAIEKCDVVIVLIGKDTHNAPGVMTELRIARKLKKPIFQVKAKGRDSNGVQSLGKPIPWRWKHINEKLDAISK